MEGTVYKSKITTRRKVNQDDRDITLELLFLEELPIKRALFVTYNPQDPTIASIAADIRWAQHNYPYYAGVTLAIIGSVLLIYALNLLNSSFY